ncbi:MAG TPA: hypothetical protein PLM93_06540 [Sulfuricurvum sp.]|nr:MAG: hypothetical protein B7Y30_04845 [Campylobacterales bacterium 16-40-21]OZA02562.1 MAG: hypothetical protein B7X89_08885 [Sulfuricurvum sp. 17-40-25]HQS66824.1 hypothetical protein [Sulfuricurvum sp.]HQT36047.1 hypothetical protein [Sulfuricurvum sp.]
MDTIQWIMLGTFIIALGLTLLKLYVFFPNKPLLDDDTTPQAVAKLQNIMVECDRLNPHLDEENLFQKIREHPEFDSTFYWRFNLNRLRHLIENYRLQKPNFRH